MLSGLGTVGVAASASAQMVQSFAPTGVLRASINLGNPILAKKDAITGLPVGVSVDLATGLAAKLGVPLQLVVFSYPAQSLQLAQTEFQMLSDFHKWPHKSFWVITQSQ